MKRLLAVFLILLSSSSQSQVMPEKVYHWDDLPEIYQPDTVLNLSLRKMKLDSLPERLSEFKQLRSIDLSKNKLTQLPAYFSELDSLVSVNLERNRFELFPVLFCRMNQLERINLGLNQVSSIPACIGEMSSLKVLLLYDNPITAFPPEMEQLQQLKELDLSGIRFGDTFQNYWLEHLPKTKVVFDAPCDCFD